MTEINWQTDYWGGIIPLGSSGLPLDPLAMQVFLNFSKSLGLTEIWDVTYFGVVQAWRPGVRPPSTVPPYTGPIENPVPARPWWGFLGVTQPRTKIYTAYNLVKIYRSAGLAHPPQISDVARIASVSGTGYDVWAVPLPGSEWICIFNGDVADPPQPGFILWVSGNDMRAMP